NPYQDLPERAFWKLAVDGKQAAAIAQLWEPRFPIDRQTSIVTVGSCFAQHIGRALRGAEYRWLDAEPCAFLCESEREAFGYGLFSFRTGNIYTAALLKQWLSWALGKSAVPTEIWQSQGRWLDPFRPAIEPDGFESAEELLALRSQTLAAIRHAVHDADVWVFTLGLTEAWRNTQAGYWYPMCPGTVGGEFDPSTHAFHNFSHAEVTQDVRDVIALVRGVKPGARFLFTVSPVPLTATASGDHVLVATEHSKSTLRSVVGELVRMDGGLDYFPSYEIITGHPFRGAFFSDNMRTVKPEGVTFVMRHFFSAIQAGEARESQAAVDYADDPQCEDALLEAFGKK
ncbi:MAG: GSCFA domain-containing protein, partial [Ramlibacter sp.]